MVVKANKHGKARADTLRLISTTMARGTGTAAHRHKDGRGTSSWPAILTRLSRNSTNESVPICARPAIFPACMHSRSPARTCPTTWMRDWSFSGSIIHTAKIQATPPRRRPKQSSEADQKHERVAEQTRNPRQVTEPRASGQSSRAQLCIQADAQ